MIPTAEEFLDFDIPNVDDYNKAIKSAIEFAKLHVTAALQAANRDADLIETDGEIDGDTILNAYPLTNIK